MNSENRVGKNQGIDKFFELQLKKYNNAYEKNSFEIDKYLLLGTGGGIATIIGLNIKNTIPQEIINLSILYLALLGVITLYRLYLSEVIAKKYYEELKKIKKRDDSYENKKNDYYKLLKELPERKIYDVLEKIRYFLMIILVLLVIILFIWYLFFCVNLIFS